MSIPDKNGIFATHYLLKELISSGTLEETWVAEDWTQDGAPVTVRIFAPRIRLDARTLEMMQREMNYRASLSHPYLLVPLQVGVHDGIPFEVMPAEANQTLSQLLLSEGAIAEQELALLIEQAGSALHFLHTQEPRLLHKRLSPDQIYITPEGDFLLSAPLLSSQLRTVLHKATGTPVSADTAYAAPELFGTHPSYSEASDVFALGVTLFELCTTETPWLGSGGLSLTKGAEVPSLSGEYSRSLSNLVRACLRLEPEQRPSAGTLADEASYFLENGRWKPYGPFGDVTAESIVYKKRWPVLPIVLAVLLLGAGIAAAWFLYLKDARQNNERTKTEQPATPERRAIPDSLTEPVADSDSPITQPRKEVQASAKTPLARKPIPAKTNTEPRPAKAKPTYPRPANLQGYLNGMINEDIPIQVRDQWRSPIRKYFSADAIVYAKINDSPLGSFGVAEFLDILVSTEASSVLVDKVIREDSGKIDEINLTIVAEN